ncbi:MULTISPECIES: heavy metal sensor histidine kinase [Acidithiobacillus]|nr:MULTISPECIES: heavy metal sensor histidine kinase [Acidithiobacillus]MBU2742069.1 heavy metal sensor histidine kinase [Acidithiobacillus albertensis]
MFLNYVIKILKRPGRSMAVRLTLWYALLSTILIAVAGAALYWILAEQLRAADSQILISKIHAIHTAMRNSTDHFSELLHEIQMESNTIRGVYIWVSRSQEGIIARGRSDNPLLDSNKPFDRKPKAFEPQQWHWKVKKHEHFQVMAQRFAGQPASIIYVAIRTSESEHFLAFYRYALALSIILALFIAILAGYLIARRGLRPVHQLASLVDELSASQLHRRIAGDNWPSELATLAENFDRLLERLEDSFARISRFSADIAHELRTPIHILRGEGELALSRNRSIPEYQACIASAMDEYERLSRMVDALLFLARAEQDHNALDKQQLDIHQEMASLCSFYQAMADEQDVTLNNDAQGSITANSDLLRRAVSNLLSNALRHTPAGGSIRIYCEQSREQVQLIVSDTGSGIADADLDRVFDRFYSADAARMRRGQGTGLGLAIVQSIVHLHGGKIRLKSVAGKGTTAILSFPIISKDNNDDNII